MQAGTRKINIRANASDDSLHGSSPSFSVRVMTGRSFISVKILFISALSKTYELRRKYDKGPPAGQFDKMFSRIKLTTQTPSSEIDIL